MATKTAKAKPTKKWGTLTNYYPYTDADDEIIYRSVRLADPKGFYQERPDGTGGWVRNMNGITPTIYHLSSVLAAAKAGKMIHIAEGEKDVDALIKCDVIATCNSGGAGKFRSEFGAHFDGAREVLIVADNDAAGKKHAAQVVEILSARGIPVRVVKAASGKDFSDHIAAGFGIDDLIPVLDHELPAPSLLAVNATVTTSIPEAVTAWNGNVIRCGSSTHVVVGGPSHGLHRTALEQDESGQWTTTSERLTDWVAWRPEVTTRLRIDDRCQPESVGVEEYTVQVLPSTGRRYLRPGFTAKESTSSREVIDATNAGVELPISRAHQGAADNMLRVLGHTEQRTVASYTSIGWCYPDGVTPVYLCPNGSVSPDGVTDEYTVGPPAGSDTAGLSTAMRRTGFAGASMPVNEAAEAVRLFCEIAPDRPEIAIALLGLVFSTPLRLTSRAVVVITGETDAGKTLLSSTAQSFFSDVSVGGKDTSSLYIPASSPIGASGVMAWYRDGLAVCDDYRRTDDDRIANARMTEVMSAVVQAAYGAAPGAKSTQTGGMRGSRDQAASALITAEVSADQAAIRNRSITLLLGRADQVTTRGGPLDMFKVAATAGAARSLMAHYIAYLARRAAAKPNGLERLTKTMQKRAYSHYARLDGNRNAETVAALATGWQAFREFAEDAGIASSLPSENSVDLALRALAASNADSATESDPGRRVLAQMSAMLAGNCGHLLSCTNDRPVIDGHSPGWERSVISSGTHGETERWDRTGPMLGWVSADQSEVLVGKAGIQAAMIAAHLTGLTAAQIYDAVARLIVPGSKPGQRCPSGLGISQRPAGFVLPVGLLGLDSAVDTPSEPELDLDEPGYEDF
jgi:5S rRNA maturation endonuclease (ribonuclease M5)